MLSPKLSNWLEQAMQMDLPMLREAYKTLLELYGGVCSEKEETAAAQTEMILQYQQMKSSMEGALKENKVLKEQNLHLTQQLQLRNRDLFGRTTESAEAIFGEAINDQTDSDPLEETAPEAPPSQSENRKKLNQLIPHDKKHGKKEKGKREQDLSGLPQQKCFLIDVDELNQKYGEGNWSIRSWTNYRTLETVHTIVYVKNTYVPVISAGLEHELVRMPFDGKLLFHSLVSPSLLAEVMYDKYTLGLPYYRIEQNYLRDGIAISRTDMASWCIRLTQELLYPVYRYLCALLLTYQYNQCDETTLQVIHDGRSAGAMSYIWTHTSGELDSNNPIVIFCYEKTRGTQHLRDFYLENDYHGTISSDSYISYDLLEKESGGKIISSRCMMHVRRRFMFAILILNLKDMPAEAIMQLPEYRIECMLDEIYEADTPLKVLEPEERKVLLQTNVRPKMEAFFQYLHELKDNWDPSYTERFRDAVDYALNNEDKLMLFLDDPLIPLDNGAAERSLKGYACGRRAWLFCNSIKGAEALAIDYSLSETAKANGVHPYYYFKYLLEQVPLHEDGRNLKSPEDLMPWSPAYREYEQEQKDAVVRSMFKADSASPPRSPKQNRRPLTCGYG